MNYIVTTTWSHPNEINKAEMADYQKNHSDRPEVVNIYWFELTQKPTARLSSIKTRLLTKPTCRVYKRNETKEKSPAHI